MRHTAVSPCKREYEIRRSDSSDDADGNLLNYDFIRNRRALNLKRDIGSTLFFCFPVALRPNAGHGLLINEVSRSHTTTHHNR